MLQCAVSDADIVTGVVCHASTFLISAGNTATPAYPVANRTLSDIRICTVLAPRMGIEPIQHFHMPLLALSMPPTYVIGIEPISHYVIRTLLIAIFRIDAVWICTTHKPYTAHVIGTRTHSAHPMFLPMCRSTSVAYLFAYASTEKQDGLRMQR